MKPIWCYCSSSLGFLASHLDIFTLTSETRGDFSYPSWCVCVSAQSCLTLCDPIDYSHQAPLSMGFPRQEYWSGLPFPSPGALPNPGIKPTCLCLLHCRQILYHWAVPSALVLFANGPCLLNWARYFQSNVFMPSCSSISTHPGLKDYRGHFFNLTWIWMPQIQLVLELSPWNRGGVTDVDWVQKMNGSHLTFPIHFYPHFQIFGPQVDFSTTSAHASPLLARAWSSGAAQKVLGSSVGTA